MSTKKQEISDFVKSLESGVISENEQSILLSGGGPDQEDSQASNQDCDNGLWCSGENTGTCHNRLICL